MRKIFISLLLILSCTYMLHAESRKGAQWITSIEEDVDNPNTWIAFRRDILIKKVPSEVIAQIGVDSKYWLWINGNLVVFEGGLKRGPNPEDTYYDEVNIAPYLKKGENKIAILVWYFGKNGFSHKSSGKAGLIFKVKDDKLDIISNSEWLCKVHPAYGNTGKPYPNYRLPESNIHFDARYDITGWQTEDCRKYAFENARELGDWGVGPWNKLVKRPIPFWKDFGIKPLEMQRIPGNDKDTIIARFPYNMQMTPVLDVTDTQGGSLISISTDHSVAGGAENVRAEYVTKRGKQTYESLGWMNGHKLILVLPKSVTVNALSYRETGYDTEPIGSFSCDNEFYMRFWEKALRTLYVNMRDTYFDCPDRERAQWWGDVVLLMGESFYTYSPTAHALMKKAIYELVGWQKKNGVLYAPIPSGRSDTELPGQSLASIGRYGFWNYYLNTGDKQTIVDAYPKVKKYLGLWQLDDTGLTAFRSGGWTWGDWGDHRDIRLIYAGWHYLALDGAAKMADVLGYEGDAEMYREIMKKLKVGYNKCWNGYAYRHPQYQKETDDRAQALAVITGIADQTQYDEIFNLFKSQKHASPYMEKYVMEALFIMGQSNYALERVQSRFAPMVDNKEYSTLFEGWDIGEKGFGGGTVNHAWSGGALTVIAQYLCGVEPLKPGYELFKIEPDLTSFKQASITVPTIAGLVKSAFIIEPDVFSLEISVPRNTQAIVYLPAELVFDISINGKTPSEKYKVDIRFEKKGKQAYLFNGGDYRIVGKK
ncbi:alpha-L-rhamnosidase C-terminal domain-containing protein [Bacteroides sp. K03]|uniref:alpha-L-rhamnosidase-related protein n=1 Tax=Bacteroides sp. K03 TaxID=2718928 RepID=UPI002107AAA5|nr:alpha-L-rhamnosidase C-terminal domain-containing protein [Bacteroides sp. K03]